MNGMHMLEEGTLFDGRYKIEAALGTGGFGTVYKARESALNRTVAIKVLTIWSDPSIPAGSLPRFQREAQTLCQMENANILKVYRYGILPDGMPFLIMEYFEGDSLRGLLQKQGALEYKFAFRIAEKLAEALQYAHSQGIVHRDLKPENVLVSVKGQNELIIKLIDFGLCKPDAPESKNGQATLTGTGELLGSPEYMSPEQALGQKLDKRTDIYSFGLIVFEMLTGRQPQIAPTIPELLLMRISKRIPELVDLNPNSGLSTDLDAFIQGCTAIQADSRLQSFDEIISELKVVQNNLPPGKFQYSGKTQDSRVKITLYAFVAVLALAMFAASFYLFKNNPAQSVQTAVQSVETPKQTTEKALAEVRKIIDAKDYKQAAAVSKKYTSARTFEKWTPMQQARLQFELFKMFSTTPDQRSTEFHLLNYIRCAEPIFRKSAAFEPETAEQVREIHNYMMTNKKVSRQLWMAANTILDTLPWQSYHRMEGIMLSELAAEALLRSYQTPTAEARWKYSKDLGGLVSLSAQLQEDALVSRYAERALAVAKQEGIKRVEAYVYAQRSKYELSKGHVEEARKDMIECNRVLDEISNSPDAAEVKLSHRVEMFEIEANVNKKLAEICLAKGDKKGADKHNALAMQLTKSAAVMEKEVGEEAESIRTNLRGLTGSKYADSR